MARIQPTTESGAPPVLAEAAEAPAPACAQEHESDGAIDATRRDTAKRGKKAAKKSRRLLVLKGHTNLVRCLAALDGGRLASASNDASILIWNLADGMQLATKRGHRSGALSLAALDGDRLASSDKADNCIVLWNAEGTQIASAEARRDLESAELRLADGTPLVQLGMPWSRGQHYGRVRCLAALAGGRLASGSDDKSVIIWNPPFGNQSQVTRLEGHTKSVYCLAALDGDRLASGSVDKSVIIWNLADGEQLAKLEGHRGPVYCLAALDGGRLASGSSDETVIIWNLEEGRKITELGGGAEARTKLGEEIRRGMHDPPLPGEQDAARAAYRKGLKSLGLGGHYGYVMCLAALDGDRLASGSADNSVIIWNLADGKQLARLEGHTDTVWCLAALADDRLASGSSDGTIRVRPVLHSTA